MRKNRRFTLRETAYRMLFEQDEEAEETEEDALGGEEEGEEEEAEGAGEAEDEAEEEQEEEEVDVTPEEEYALSDSIDKELNDLLIDFEAEARKSAVVNQPEELEETVYRKLFEAAAEDIDLNSFAGNVARLVKNYQNLIDWESVILNKAESFINNHYGEDTARVLLDILEDDYDIAKQGKEEELPPAPIAVGARGEGGG